jgi:hypothetical protein
VGIRRWEDTLGQACIAMNERRYDNQVLGCLWIEFHSGTVTEQNNPLCTELWGEIFLRRCLAF